MNTNKKVFDKLFSNEKVELASDKFEFALTDDLKGILNGIENDPIEGIYSDSIKISSDLEILKNKAKDRISSNDSSVQSSFNRIKLAEQYLAQAERISKELGTDAKSIPNYSNVLNAKNKLQDLIKKLSPIQNKLKSLI